MARYRPLYDLAVRVTKDAPSPYEAVLSLESWLRQSGGFRYDQQPPRSQGVTTGAIAGTESAVKR